MPISASRRFARLGRPALALLCGLCVASTTSCSTKSVSGFAWKGRSGVSLAFSQSGSRPEGSEGLFSQEDKADRYVLRSPLDLEAGEAIEVSLKRSGGGAARAQLALSARADGSSPLSSALIPLHGERVVACLPLAAKSRIASLAVVADAGSFSLESVEIVGSFRGIDQRSSVPRVSSGFSLQIEGGREEYRIERPFAGLAGGASGGSSVEAAKGAARPGLLVAYGPAPLGSSMRIQARLPDGSERDYKLRLRPAGTTTVLDEGLVPAEAASVSLSAPKGVAVGAFYAAMLPASDYELADLGRVLLSDAPIGDYALYRWDMLPSVLVFDFKDYATQDRYLKRLAFFVEKVGYRGVLAKDEEIGPLHGWNAHDYRAEDLASFFEAARAKAFPLDKEEKELKAILLGSGILREESGKVVQGSGAIISITRETAAGLRWTLAVHESSHGILFVDADYRAYVQKLWASLDAGEKWFWRTYLTWALYDTSSSYLISNEFQAYLVQQPTAMAREYFEKRKSAELLEKHPEMQEKVDAYFAQYGDSFAARAKELESWLYAKYAVQAGRTVFLTRSRP